MPDLAIEKTARIACRNHTIAEMQMRTVRLRKSLDRHLARAWAPARSLRIARKHLQNRERAQLQRIELQRVEPGRHVGIPVALLPNACKKICHFRASGVPKVDQLPPAGRI